MKKLFVTMLVLAAGQMASARTIQIGELLSIKVSPLHFRADASKETVVRINDFGHVTSEKCPKFGRGACVIENLGRISWSEVQQVRNDINKARYEVLRFPSANDIVCMAVPFESYQIVADNNRLLLAVGSRPCGRDTISRNGQASSRLMQKINKFYYQTRR